MNINSLVLTIQNLCIKNNLSVDKMLKECGLKPTVVDNLKKGSIPSVDKVCAIAEYFNVTTDYLLGLDTEPNRNPKENTLNPNDNYENCYVACLDILGFSEYIKKNSFDDIWGIFDAYFYIKRNMPVKPQGTAFLPEEMAKLQLNLVSDTIVISIKKSEKRSLEMLVFAVDVIIHNVMINSELPVRGAISEGEFYSSEANDCFWGSAVIRAHELESKNSIYPRIIIPTAIFKEYEDSVTGDDKRNINYLVKLDSIVSDGFYIVNYVRYILGRLVVDDENAEIIRKAWDVLIDDYEKKLESEKDLHILNKYIYFAKYYNTELLNPSEFLFYHSKVIKCRYNDFLEEQSTQSRLSKDKQRLLEMYDKLTDMEKGEILGELKTLTRDIPMPAAARSTDNSIPTKPNVDNLDDFPTMDEE